MAGTGVEPGGVPEQVPRPLMLQAWQGPQLGDEQQTPSTQALLVHWLPAPQVLPLASLTTQMPVATPGFWQKLPAAHWASAVQPAIMQVPVVVPGFWQKLPAPHWASAVQCAHPVVVQKSPVAAQFVVVGAAQVPVPVQ